MTHDALRWLREVVECDQRNIFAGCFALRGFAEYARLMHPVHKRGENGRLTPVRWQAIAAVWHRNLEDEIRRVNLSAQPSQYATSHAEQNLDDAHRLWDIPASRGSLPDELCAALISELRREPTLDQTVVSLVWSGFAGVEYSSRQSIGEYRLPFDRDCYVYESNIHDVNRLVSPPFTVTPALWFPRDRSWFVATDIDHSWSYIGGSQRLISRLISSDYFEAISITRQDAF